MKKIIVLFLLSVLGCSVTYAQLHIGAKVGANISNYVGDDAPHGMKMNYHVGGFLEYKILGILAIAPEVMFSTQGGTRNIADYAAGDMVYRKAKVKWQTNYVNVPVMMKLYVLNKFSFDFGPQFGFNVSSKTKTEVPNYDSQNISASTGTNKFDLALGLGLTYNFNRFMFVQGRYVMSVTKTYKSDVLGMTLPVNARNGVLQLSVGLKL